MIKVIETRTVLKELFGNIVPERTESRVIEVEDWNKYVEEIEQGKLVYRISCIGNLCGYSLPREVGMITFESNENSLMCTFGTYDKLFILMTAYRVN